MSSPARAGSCAARPTSSDRALALCRLRRRWQNKRTSVTFGRMGRIAGVTAEETKQRLLATAADVFARLGYERASIAQIASDAGLSTGAIYAHYAGKAELFVATLRAHA